MNETGIIGKIRKNTLAKILGVTIGVGAMVGTASAEPVKELMHPVPDLMKNHLRVEGRSAGHDFPEQTLHDQNGKAIHWGEQCVGFPIPETDCREGEKRIRVVCKSEASYINPPRSLAQTLTMDIVEHGTPENFPTDNTLVEGYRVLNTKDAKWTDLVPSWTHDEGRHGLEIMVTPKDKRRNAGASAPTLSVNNLSGETALDNCVVDEYTLCLNDGRFEVRADWHKGANSGKAKAIPAHGVSDSGGFYFFNSDNEELKVKVLDGEAVNGKHWVFDYGGTDVGVDLFVRDTVTGQEWSRSNPEGLLYETGADTTAFDSSKTSHPLPNYPITGWHVDKWEDLGIGPNINKHRYRDQEHALEDVMSIASLVNFGGDHNTGYVGPFHCSEIEFRDLEVCDTENFSDRAYLVINFRIAPDANGVPGMGPGYQSITGVVDMPDGISGVQRSFPIVEMTDPAVTSNDPGFMFSNIGFAGQWITDDGVHSYGQPNFEDLSLNSNYFQPGTNFDDWTRIVRGTDSEKEGYLIFNPNDL